MGLDSVELLIEVENTFGVTLHQREVTHVATVEDLHALILRSLDVVENEKDIYSRLVRLIHLQQNIPIEKIHPHSRLVDDLGID